MSIRLINPKSWHSLLTVIRERPEIWLGGKTLSGLANYIDGIFTAEAMYDIPPEKRFKDFDFHDFEIYVCLRTKASGRSFGIAKTFLKTSKTAEGDSWLLWWFWYDEYNQSDGKENYDRWKANNEQKELHGRTGSDYDDPSLY